MELMGTASPSQGEAGDKPEVDLSRDSSLLRVLDRLVLYLRVVHSLDYYNGSDYPYEDEMPNRCGIIHVRGATPEKCTLAEGMRAKNHKQNRVKDPLLHACVLFAEAVEVGKLTGKSFAIFNEPPT